MASPSKTGKFHYAYLIVLSGIMMTGTACAVVISTAGIFFSPVASYFGVSKAAFSLYFTILNVAMVVFLPLGGKLVERFDLRWVFSACILLDSLTYLAMSQFGSVWMFYLAGVVLGAATAPLIFLAVPTLVNNWCEAKVGFFVGLCMAFTGLGAVLYNPIGTALIGTGAEGWRTAYQVFGLIILVALPFTLFVVRTRPQDKGLQKFGAVQAFDEGADALSPDGGKVPAAPQEPIAGVPAKKAYRTVAFFAIAVYSALISMNQMVYQFFAAYCQSSSSTDIVLAAGIVSSACMAGQAVSKVAVGAVCDRSARAGIVMAMGCGIVGVLLLWFFPLAVGVMVAAAFLFGAAYACTSVYSPLLVRTVFGPRDYTKIYAPIGSALALGGAAGVSVWSLVVDLPDGYALMFALSIAVMAACLVLSLFALGQKKKLAKLSEPAACEPAANEPAANESSL